MRPEVMDGHNKYLCETCAQDKGEGKNDADRFTQLSALPDVLNVQLMRLEFDYKTQTKKKVKDAVALPATLDLTEPALIPMLAPALRARVERDLAQDAAEPSGRRADAYRFRLCAVLNHKGETTNTGHYTAEVLDRSRGDTWWLLDDSTVTKCDFRKDLRAEQGLVSAAAAPNGKGKGKQKPPPQQQQKQQQDEQETGQSVETQKAGDWRAPPSNDSGLRPPSRNAYMVVYDKLARTETSRVEGAFPVALPPRLEKLVAATISRLDGEAREFAQRTEALTALVQRRKDEYARIFRDHQRPAMRAADTRGAGFWVQTSWLRSWIQGFGDDWGVPAAAAAAAAARGSSSSSSNSSSSSGRSSSEAVALLDDDAAGAGQQAGVVSLVEDDDDPQVVARAREATTDVRAARSAVGKSTLPALFAAAPSSEVLLCPHSDRDRGVLRVSPTELGQMKLVSEACWRGFLATLEPEAARAAFELRTDSGLPASLTCDLCAESLTGNLARVAESAQVRARVDSILATEPATSVTAARANGQEAWLQSMALVSRAWAADWKRYSKSQGAEAGRLAAALSKGKARARARAGGAGAGDALNRLGAGLGSGSGAPPPDINASITCEHGGLAVGAQRKRLVTLQDWAFLVEHALDGACKGSTLFRGNEPECRQCAAGNLDHIMLSLRDDKAPQLRSAAKQLLRRKTGHPNLADGCLPVGDYALVPLSWLARWRAFCADAALNERPPPLLAATRAALLCTDPAHGVADSEAPRSRLHPRTHAWLFRAASLLPAEEAAPVAEPAAPAPSQSESGRRCSSCTLPWARVRARATRRRRMRARLCARPSSSPCAGRAQRVATQRACIGPGRGGRAALRALPAGRHGAVPPVAHVVFGQGRHRDRARGGRVAARRHRARAGRRRRALRGRRRRSSSCRRRGP